jgi:hypothetical protein
MKLFATSCLLFLILLSIIGTAQPLYGPFNFVMPTYDSSRSAWLPGLPEEPAGAHGFLRAAGGHLEFSDGTAARFVGAGIIASACFPDSIGALATARRLRKLGVNMVRFDYFDYSNSNGASTLAPGNRSDSLSPTQMARFDWFLYQLKQNGIYSHFVLKSRNAPRRDDGVPGWDSTYNSGRDITYFVEPYQRMQQAYLTKFFNHINPYTGLSYAREPAVALLTLNDQNSFYDSWISDRLNAKKGVLSILHSRMLDTMFTAYLKKKYGTTAALRNAYFEGSKTLGANVLANPGFESLYDRWVLTVGEGAKAAPVIIQGPGVAPGEGESSLRIAIQQTNGNESRIYLDQFIIPMRRGGIYHLSFKAKTDSAAGRPIRMALFRGVDPFDNFGFNQTVNLTNAWQTFNYTFRSSGTDSLNTILRLYLGKQMGDVFLDGFVLQETGREGLAANESLDSNNIYRALFQEAPGISLQRMLDQTSFYDSLARAYYRTMQAHIRGLGVSVPLAGTNNDVASADSWIQSDYDFTAESAQWDFNGTRPGSPAYSDSTWVIRNYSILNYVDQKIPEFSRVSIVGKPFIAEAYNHVFPNVHRSEMMLFYPAYGSLHGWDGIYFYSYNDRQTDLTDRRAMIKDDFQGFMADPSICAMLPQVSAIMRNGWIAPAQRTIRINHDRSDLLSLPLTYYQRGTYDIDGSFANVANLVSDVRIDSFTASRHYTANDYYFTVPSNDNVQSDTRQITLDITKGVMSVNTPRAQGGSGALASLGSLRTDDLSVSWIDGARHVSYLWTSLDTSSLAHAPRSLLTISTRAANTGAAWQFGDSSFGKNWGTAPVQMESAKVSVSFFTDADSLIIHPLDTLAQPTGAAFGAERNANGSWRVVIDMAVLKTPWFGVEQRFAGMAGTGQDKPEATPSIGQVYPNPTGGLAELRITAPAGSRLSARLCNSLGQTVADFGDLRPRGGDMVLPIDLRELPSGTYSCIVALNGRVMVRKVVVGR